MSRMKQLEMVLKTNLVAVQLTETNVRELNVNDVDVCFKETDKMTLSFKRE